MDRKCLENNKKDCTGCSACIGICPNKAVQMVYNSEGFATIEIDKNKCVKCGLCIKVCPLDGCIKSQKLLKAYYGRSKNEEIVKKSSSGGIFTVLAEKILKENGIVYGAAYDYNSKSVIYTSTEKVDLDSLRRSKYVWSNPQSIFLEIKNKLLIGKKILFCGMPCHVSGLYNYLGRDYENLITLDFVCGGCSSPVIFKEYLEDLEKKYNSKVKNINFRPKLKGWNLHMIKIDFFNKKSYKNYGYCDPFFRGYIYSKALVREACSGCHFRYNHSADIILADFWKFKDIKDLVEDNKGYSLVVTNSLKGEKIIEEIKISTGELSEIPFEISKYNFTVEKYISNPKRKEFFEVYKREGFKKASKTYMKGIYLFKLKQLLKLIIK